MPQTSRVRLSTETRRAEIIAAVIQLSAERSPALITTGDIANVVALTQGAVFRHFPSKDAIWLAVMEWVKDNLLGSLEAAARAAPNPLEAMRAIFMAHVRFVMTHPGVPRIIFSELQRPDETPMKVRVRSILERYQHLLMGLLDAAEKHGDIAPSIDKAGAAMLFIGTIQGLVMQSMLLGSTERMIADANRVFLLYCNALRSKS